MKSRISLLVIKNLPVLAIATVAIALYHFAHTLSIA